MCLQVVVRLLRSSTHYFNMDKKFQTLETLATLSLAAGVIGFLTKNVGFYYAATLLIFIGLFVKPLANVITKAWLKFSHVLGAINSKILLGLLFFLILSPLGFLFRKFKGDSLKIKKKSAEESSYWVTKDHQYLPQDFEHTW